MSTKKSKRKIIAAYSVRSHELQIVDHEQLQMMLARNMEAEPLLSEQELIAEMRKILIHLPAALQILQQMSPGHYRGFNQQHLHAMGHVFQMAMCLTYQQPLKEYEGKYGMLCRLLVELGIEAI